jgi:hypothetical protein
MDVNCLYYNVNDSGFAKDGYPLKLHECLASGSPLVSAGLRSVCEFKDDVLIAGDYEDWVTKIKQAIETPNVSPSNEKDRINVAMENSWDERVSVILKVLQAGIE